MEKKILATNSKALFNYTVVDKIEAGLKLFGYEVKAVRTGQASMTGSYVTITQDLQVQLHNLHIPKYEKASTLKEYHPTRSRTLLLNKREILKIKNHMTQKGLTLIPLSLYSKGAFVKVELGLCKGKKKADKKAVIKQRDIDRDIERFLKFE
ncbi:SsrA-binding protein SmpB [Candidatus Falkowbacteria bacterium]|nr:SsrA-binding protein SmpB [Candidatus Falkowbacteria bacterium]